MNILVSVGSAGLPRDRSPSAIKRPYKHNKSNLHSDKILSEFIEMAKPEAYLVADAKRA